MPDFAADIPRPEHPRPQFERDAWLNLNGPWTFRFDFGDSGEQAGWCDAEGFEQRITVPFCPESTLSGVGHTDFIPAMWYHRRIEVPADWAGRAILLHFGGVDYESEVYLDGRSMGRHFGGASSFTVDLTGRAEAGRMHHLVVRVRDATRSGLQPLGKQCPDLHSRGCHYTRTTGIWQTVWLEAMHPAGLTSMRITPDLHGGRFLIAPRLRRSHRGLHWRVTASDGASAEGPLIEGIPLSLALNEPRAWSPDDPYLHDLTVEVLDGGTVIDRIASYAGLRQFEVDGTRLRLNGEPIFLRLVLDQGFYPEGIWTAPSDQALKRDIALSQAIGFNGGRLHQKVFEPRFHYWADRLGYLTWGEAPSWGVNLDHRSAVRNFFAEWPRLVERDRNHPSIIAWAPFNETWLCRGRDGLSETLRTLDEVYDMTRAIDPTRPVVTASGGDYAVQDLVTIHSYEQDPKPFGEMLDTCFAGLKNTNIDAAIAAAADRPKLVDEYGGTRWNPNQPPERRSSWGYGNDPSSEAEFIERITALTHAIVDRADWSGYCYTQLTDVEQEQNGLYFYDRTPKFDAAQLRPIFARKPDWSRW